MTLFGIAPHSPLVAQTIVRDTTARRGAAGNTVVWIDAGAARTRQRPFEAGNAMTLGAGLQRSTARTSFHFDGAAFLGADSASAAQLGGSFALSPLTSGLLQTDVSGSIARFRPFDDIDEGSGTWQLRQHLRGHLGAASMGLRITAAGSRSTRRDTIVGAVGRFDASAQGAGVFVTQRGVTLDVSWQRVHTTDWMLVEAAGHYLSRNASAYDYDRVGLSLHYQLARVQLQGNVDWQTGRSATVGRSHASSIAAAYALRDDVSLFVSTGAQVADLLRGYPRARYTTVGVRYAHVLGSRAVSPLLEREATLELPPVSGGIVILRVQAPAGAVVEVASSAEQWTPMRLTRLGDAYVGRVVLPSGTHRIAVRVNGGEWRAPRGLARVADDLGGEVGLVVVP